MEAFREDEVTLGQVRALAVAVDCGVSKRPSATHRSICATPAPAPDGRAECIEPDDDALEPSLPITPSPSVVDAPLAAPFQRRGRRA